MLKVLTQFSRAGDHLPLSNPLLQLVHFPVELVKPVLLLQTALPLLYQVLQGHIKTVDLRLTLADLLTVKRKEIMSQGKYKKSGNTWEDSLPLPYCLHVTAKDRKSVV